MTTEKKAAKKKGDAGGERWWRQADWDAHADVFAYVRHLEESQAAITRKNLLNAKLYGNCDLAGLTWTTSKRTYDRRPGPTVTENLIQSTINTLTAKIAKNQPRVTFQTDGGNWSTQRRAVKLTRFVEAEFHRTGLYKAARASFRDACVFGLGALKIVEGDDGRIACERVIPDDIIVDDLACRSSGPREVHQRIFIDRDVLEAWIPDLMADETEERRELAIQAVRVAHQGDRRYTSFRHLESHQVALVESWRLPSRPGKKDGRHTLVLEGATLVDEPWTEDDFPFVFFWYEKPLTGFYGEGLAEKLTGHQVRLNKQNRVIEESQDRVARPRIFVRRGDANLKTQFTNEIGTVIVCNETPTFSSPPALSPEIYNERNYTKQSAYNFSGISELAATAKKPGGFSSGEALREYHDRETERFAIQEIDYEDVHLDCGRRFVALAKELYKGEFDQTSVWKQGPIVKRIKWSEIDLKADAYMMSIEAASLLSRTPAGRTNTIEDWAERGLLSTDAVKRLLGHPDLEREVSLMTASIEYAEAWIERVLDEEGAYIPPEPFENLELGIARRTQAYLKARIELAPEKVLQPFRDWITTAQSMRAKALAAAPQGQTQPPPSAFAMGAAA